MSISKKLLFVFNPISGKANIKNNIYEIIDIFTKAEYDVTVRPTQTGNDAHEYIKENAGEYDAVVVSGGDGTLNQAVSAMMSFPKVKRKPLGYIPAGTTNDFAHSRGIPSDALDAALKIAEGNTIKCDIGTFNNRYFTYVAAFGAFTDVSYDTPQDIKNIFGHGAYVLEGIKRLANLESYKISLQTEDTFVEDYFFLGLILNSTSLAGLNLKQNIIDLNDGLFEIVLIKRPVNLFQIQEIFNLILTGNTEENDTFKLIKTSKAQICSEKVLKWTLDGEFGGEYDNVQMTVEQSALTLLG